MSNGSQFVHQRQEAFSPRKRSSGALKQRRVPLGWPDNQDFRILSIDGGGIRGIFPSSFLAGLEDDYLGGSSIVQYFDLITGTSTGGIIALGLAAGLHATELRDLYIERGREIFPPGPQGVVGKFVQPLMYLSQCFKFRYDQKALLCVLRETFGDQKFGEAQTRLCIPACDGHYGEVYIFKTPHHTDYRLDAKEDMTKVAMATSAAPTYFRPFEDGGYTFVDGGVWANNPIMIGLVDTLSCYSVPRDRIRILSLGCGETPYVVKGPKLWLSGKFTWHDIIFAAMKFEALNALGQAQLLIGADKITRINAPIKGREIQLDDWPRAVAELPKAAAEVLQEHGENVASVFLSKPVKPYHPVVGF